MNVFIVGSGGREHALAWACARSDDGVQVLIAPGNGGTRGIAESVAVNPVDADAIASIARARRVDLVVIGPDAAAAAGVADACNAGGIPVFGPTAAAARVESSKEFAKSLMDEAHIRTARWRSGGVEDIVSLQAFIEELDGRCAVKADGLALGKGVTVCGSVSGARRALEACLLHRRFGEAGRRVVVEELLQGPEVSVLGVTDGQRVRVLPPARDYKRAHDGDAGANTGGMGAIAPPPDIDVERFCADVSRDVLQPCVDALRSRGTPFVGCLYAGLMLTSSGVRVLEFNARFGDPEAQVILPLLDEPALTLFASAANGSVQAGVARRREAAAVGIVAAAEGYPEQPRTGDVITGVESLDPDVLCFQAGTALHADGTLRTSGGRVLCVVGVAGELEEARLRAYDNIHRVRFDGMHVRGDIGRVHVTASVPAGAVS
jgi:phosphoribosylamine--glycine ligase